MFHWQAITMQTIKSWTDSKWDQLYEPDIAYGLVDWRKNVVYIGETTRTKKEGRFRDWLQNHSATGITLVNTPSIVEVYIWTVESGKSKEAEALLHKRYNPPCSSANDSADSSIVDLDEDPDYIFKVIPEEERKQLSNPEKSQQVMRHIAKLLDLSQLRLPNTTATGNQKRRADIIERSLHYYFNIAENTSKEYLEQFK